MPRAQRRDRVALLLEPIDSGEWRAVPMSVRLRRLQRAMARGYGLRVVAEKPVPVKAETVEVRR